MNNLYPQISIREINNEDRIKFLKSNLNYIQNLSDYLAKNTSFDSKGHRLCKLGLTEIPYLINQLKIIAYYDEILGFLNSEYIGERINLFAKELREIPNILDLNDKMSIRRKEKLTEILINIKTSNFKMK